MNQQYYCICGDISSNKCLLRSCKKCCMAKGCQKHNEEAEIIEESNKTCNLCCKKNEQELEYYINDMLDKKIYYCELCYFLNNDKITKIKENNFTKVKKNKKNKVINTKNRVKEFEKFMENYKNKIITKDIFENEIKTHKDYDFSEIMTSEYKYECPECENITTLEESYFCDDCDILVCDNKCINEKNRKCCENNCCNNIIERYCNSCYVDDDKIFYEKYKNITINQQILYDEEENINLEDFNDKEYELEYLCSICKEKTKFSSEKLSQCENCNDTICENCYKVYYFGCDRNNCRFCENKTCYYGKYKCICNSCCQFKKIARSTSPSIIAEDEKTQCCVCMTNIKKYACVPCGHLCLCGECGNKIEDECPICKEYIKEIIKIFS